MKLAYYYFAEQQYGDQEYAAKFQNLPWVQVYKSISHKKRMRLWSPIL